MITDKYFFKDIPLIIPDKYDPSKNSYTIFIGNNGVGKSRLLDALSRSLIEENESFHIHDNAIRDVFWDKKIIYSSTMPHIARTKDGIQNDIFPIFLDKAILVPDTVLNNSSNSPKVITVSTSPFDSFKLPSRNSDKKTIRKSNYRYIGMRSSNASTAASISLINSASSGLLEKLGHSENFQRLAKVFEVLEFDPSLEFAFKPMYKDLITINPLSLPHQTKFLNFLDPDGRITEIENTLGIRADAKSHITLKTLPDEILQEIKISLKTINSFFPNKPHLKLKAVYLQSWSYQFDGEHENNHLILNAIQILLKYDLIKLMDLRLSKASNRTISLRRASSGEQCMLVIMLGIAGHITDNSSIFIDEPEISLHPKWQEKFMSLLIEVFSTYSGCNFYIATHSPQIISKLSEENCFITSLAKKEIHHASDFKDRSADFQLAELFDAPGSMNEYLIRMAFGLISRIKAAKQTTDKDRQEITKLKNTIKNLEQDDPLLELIKTVFEMNDYYASNK